MKFKEWIINELRSKSYFNRLNKEYPNIPRYVAKDAWKNQTGGDWIKDKETFQKESPGENFNDISYIRQGRNVLNTKKWKLEVINLHWNILAQRTQTIILDRKFGLVNPNQVGNDEQRFKKQRETLTKVAEGENEPIVMFYENGKYDLQEGFHRTMTYLLSGGGDPAAVLNQMKNLTGEEMANKVQAFRPVKIKAWVGYGL